MTDDHTLLTRLEERFKERSESAAKERERLEDTVNLLVAGVSSINLRLAHFETRLEMIQSQLIKLNGVNYQKDLMNRGTAVVGGGGVMAAVIAVGRALGWW